MSVRNSKEIGDTIVKIVLKLAESDRLLRLLKYTDENPFDETLHENVPLSSVLHKNLKIVPLVNETEDDTESTVVVLPTKGEVEENNEFKEISFSILVYVPLSKWIINDTSLRPFLIISEIEKKLKNARVESLGTIKYLGFSFNLITDIMSCYKMEFVIDAFN